MGFLRFSIPNILSCVLCNNDFFSLELIDKYCVEALENSKKDLDFQRVQKDKFKKCPNISIDVAVMENTKKGIVIPLDAGWSDIGSWDNSKSY